MEAWRLTSRGTMATLGVALLCVALLCVAVATPAAARTIAPAKRSGPGTTHVTLASGTLRVSAARAVASAKGPVKVSVTVTDARGTGAGWTLRLARGANVTVTSITARCSAHSTCTLPSAAAKPSGKTVLRAAKASGMGLIDLVVTVRAATATTVGFAVS